LLLTSELRKRASRRFDRSQQKLASDRPSGILYRVSLSVWTIGHSTRSAADFRRVLSHHGIDLVVDVRRFPGSRRLPQFASDALNHDLAHDGIVYRWVPELGGRRQPNAASVNVAWRHSAFRAYADHIATDEFAQGLNEVLMAAYGLRTVLMCAELLWWRCHRRLIADVLTALGIQVFHLRGEEQGTLHHLAPPARLVGGVLSY
jgi:uncharacterized protein (DUF488 family)